MRHCQSVDDKAMTGIYIRTIQAVNWGSSLQNTTRKQSEKENKVPTNKKKSSNTTPKPMARRRNHKRN